MALSHSPGSRSAQLSKLQLRRRSDGLTYFFVRVARQDGTIGYLRSDEEVWIEYDARLGWVVRDPQTKELTGRPWNEARAEEQDRDCPPEGAWVSKKGDKSYVYDLVFTGQDTA